LRDIRDEPLPRRHHGRYQRDLPLRRQREPAVRALARVLLKHMFRRPLYGQLRGLFDQLEVLGVRSRVLQEREYVRRLLHTNVQR
jgi:hypothetical protein